MNNLNEHDKREIEALKKEREQYKKWKAETANLSNEEIVELFLKKMKGE